MEELKLQLVEKMKAFIADAEKKPTKAGAARMRKLTTEITKIGKEFRKASIAESK